MPGVDLHELWQRAELAVEISRLLQHQTQLAVNDAEWDELEHLAGSTALIAPRRSARSLA